MFHTCPCCENICVYKLPIPIPLYGELFCPEGGQHSGRCSLWAHSPTAKILHKASARPLSHPCRSVSVPFFLWRKIFQSFWNWNSYGWRWIVHCWSVDTTSPGEVRVFATMQDCCWNRSQCQQSCSTWFPGQGFGLFQKEASIYHFGPRFCACCKWMS